MERSESSAARGQCVVSLGMTLSSHSASLRQVCKWWAILLWINIPPRESSEATVRRFTPLKPEVSASLMGHLSSLGSYTDENFVRGKFR